jgi:hypothetical protein
MYSHDAKCPTSPEQPEPTGFCDRCQQKYFLKDLRWQWDQRGQSLQNLRIRVCPKDYDDPSTFLRPIEIRGPEGVVRDARPFLTSPSEEADGPQLPLAPNFPLAIDIESEADPGPIAPVYPGGGA